MKKIISLILSAAMLSGILTGCGTPEPKNNCVVIVSKSANLPAPDPSMLEGDLMQTARSNGQVQVIRLDGQPVLTDTLSMNQRPGFYTEAQLEERAKERLNLLESAIAAVEAQAPECNLLGALQLAADSVEATENETNALLICSSGINTVAPLNMSEVVLKAIDIEATVSALQEKGAIPDLSDYDQVKFFMLGRTAPPQEPLTPQDKTALQELWTKILYAAGLNEAQVTFVTTPTRESDPVEGLPPVSTVTVLHEDNAITTGETQQQSNGGINVTLSQNSVAFIPDTAKLADPSTAEDALRPTAQALAQNSETQVLIIGQTATVGEAEFCRKLSLERAQCVADILEKLGANTMQLTCLGLGYDPSPLRVQDVSPDSGALVEEQAIRNRVVHILDATTPLAQEILTQYQ